MGKGVTVERRICFFADTDAMLMRGWLARVVERPRVPNRAPVLCPTKSGECRERTDRVEGGVVLLGLGSSLRRSGRREIDQERELSF